jgi:hypothetical protein
MTRHLNYSLYQTLYSIGFFTQVNLYDLDLRLRDFSYDIYLSCYNYLAYEVNISKFNKMLRLIYHVLNKLIISQNLFSFISLTANSSFFYETMLSTFKKLKIYFIYDWGFGILTNDLRIYTNHYNEKKHCLANLPDTSFVLAPANKQRLIATELKRRCILSIGPANHHKPTYIDYPIPSNISLSYSYFFFRFFIKILLIHIYNYYG